MYSGTPPSGLSDRSPRPKASRRTPAAAGALIFVIVATVVAAGLSPSPLILVLSGITLFVCILLLWTVDDLPLLIFPVAYQWSEISAKPIATIFYDVPLDSLSDYGASLLPGAALGLIGLMFLAVGLRLGAGPQRDGIIKGLNLNTAHLPFRTVLGLSLTAIILGHLLYNVSGLVGPARQIFLALAQVKLAGLFVLSYWCFKHHRGYLILMPLVGMEIVVGMLGFFADFRSPVLIVFLAAIAARPRLRAGDLSIGAVIALVIILAASFWSWVKPDYREFVNLGTGQQIVARPIDERLDFLAGRAMQFDLSDMGRGFEALVFRHSYIDFLSQTMIYVPEREPHADGRQLGQSIMHILTPRILFPEKAVLINDSDLSAYYTGLPLNRDPNTSISLGYLAEFYIDFGAWGALLGMLILGGTLGFMYRLLRRQANEFPLVSFGLAAMWALTFASFGIALIKLVGFVVITFIAALVIRRLALPFLAPVLFGRKLLRQQSAP